MCKRLAVPEPAALFQRLLDLRVRVEHAHAAEQLHGVEEVTCRSDGGINVEAVLDPRIEVVGAVARRRVHRAGAGIERHVLAEHGKRAPIVKRMVEPDAFELRALHARDRPIEAPADNLTDHRRKRFGDDDGAPLDVVRRVVEFRMKCDRQIRRNGPWRRRPDEDGHVASGQRRNACREIAGARRLQRELDVDRRRRVIFVLDFRFGQRRAAVDAPVNRLLAFVDESALHEFSERPRDCRLVPEIHRQIRVRPVAQNPEPLKLLRHRGDEALRVRAARSAEFGHRHVALLRAQLAIDLQLDRQAVAVVARLVRRVEAGHRSRLDDEILEHFVERGAHVDVAVGVRRTVVQNVFLLPFPARLDFSVQIHGGPARERLRLARREVRLHRKMGPRQVDGVFPLRHGYPTIL